MGKSKSKTVSVSNADLSPITEKVVGETAESTDHVMSTETRDALRRLISNTRIQFVHFDELGGYHYHVFDELELKDKRMVKTGRKLTGGDTKLVIVKTYSREEIFAEQ